MVRFLIICTCLTAIMVGCTFTRQQERDAKNTGGTVATLLGLPRPVGEGVVGLALLALGGVGGHKNGRRAQRRHAEKAMKAV